VRIERTDRAAEHKKKPMKLSTHQTREDLQDTPSHQREHGQAEAGPWRGVFFDGPQPDTDPEGEEIPVWYVYVGDEEAEPIGTVYHVHAFVTARSLAEAIARDRRLELIAEAATA
jgi:hypothetical protein